MIFHLTLEAFLAGIYFALGLHIFVFAICSRDWERFATQISDDDFKLVILILMFKSFCLQEWNSEKSIMNLWRNAVAVPTREVEIKFLKLLKCQNQKLTLAPNFDLEICDWLFKRIYLHFPIFWTNTLGLVLWTVISFSLKFP